MSIQLGTSQAEQIVLKPGEVVKFSQSGPVSKPPVWEGAHTLVIAKKGFNYGGGFAMPLKDLTGKTVDLKPTDTLTYDAFSNNITSGKTSQSGNTVTGSNAHTRHFSITHHEVYVARIAAPAQGRIWQHGHRLGLRQPSPETGETRATPGKPAPN